MHCSNTKNNFSYEKYCILFSLVLNFLPQNIVVAAAMHYIHTVCANWNLFICSQSSSGVRHRPSEKSINSYLNTTSQSHSTKHGKKLHLSLNQSNLHKPLNMFGPVCLASNRKTKQKHKNSPALL